MRSINGSCLFWSVWIGLLGEIAQANFSQRRTEYPRNHWETASNDKHFQRGHLHPTCYKAFYVFRSGRADFDSAIRRFDPSRPSQKSFAENNRLECELQRILTDSMSRHVAKISVCFQGLPKIAGSSTRHERNMVFSQHSIKNWLRDAPARGLWCLRGAPIRPADFCATTADMSVNGDSSNRH